MPYPSKTDRETILAAAMKQVESHGAESRAIRGGASSLGLAPNALYRYFENLAALEFALAEESRRRMLEVLRKGTGRKTPEHAVRGLAAAYVRFARERPQVFALTLKSTGKEEDDNLMHRQSWRFVLEQVGRLYGEKQAPEAAVALWAFLHGFIMLAAAGVFGEQKPSSSFEFGLHMWLNGASARKGKEAPTKRRAHLETGEGSTNA